MARLCQYPTEQRAKGLLWLLNLEPEVLRRGPIAGRGLMSLKTHLIFNPFF